GEFFFFKQKTAYDMEIETIVEVADDLTSQSRHSLLLQGSPPSGKLLIPLARRDVRVVEGARLESVCRGNSTEGSNPSLSANQIKAATTGVFRHSRDSVLKRRFKFFDRAPSGRPGSALGVIWRELAGSNARR